MNKLTLSFLTLVFLGCGRSVPVADRTDETAEPGTVTLVIIGESETNSIDVPNVPSGTSLETVMRSVTEIPIKLDGSGTSAFVDAIGDQRTNSTGGWTFEVDGEYANQGIGNTVLTPPTTVTWSFGDFGGP